VNSLYSTGIPIANSLCYTGTLAASRQQTAQESWQQAGSIPAEFPQHSGRILTEFYTETIRILYRILAQNADSKPAESWQLSVSFPSAFWRQTGRILS